MCRAVCDVCSVFTVKRALHQAHVLSLRYVTPPLIPLPTWQISRYCPSELQNRQSRRESMLLSGGESNLMFLWWWVIHTSLQLVSKSLETDARAEWKMATLLLLEMLLWKSFSGLRKKIFVNWQDWRLCFGQDKGIEFPSMEEGVLLYDMIYDMIWYI